VRELNGTRERLPVVPRTRFEPSKVLERARLDPLIPNVDEPFSH
jgi:hypothetical protein